MIREERIAAPYSFQERVEQMERMIDDALFVGTPRLFTYLQMDARIYRLGRPEEPAGGT